MYIMSNSRAPACAGEICDRAARAATGGGRAPTEVGSDKIRPLTTSTQIFKIPDEGGLALQRFILEKILFHIALFPYISLPDQETH